MTKIFCPYFLTYLLENEPRHQSEAMSCLETFYWKETVNSKFESIMNIHTWKLVDLHSRNKLLGHKWIFKKNIKADGTIDKYRGKLCC